MTAPQLTGRRPTPPPTGTTPPADRPARRAWAARWAADLGLGLRLAFAGGRANLARTLLTATGVGLGVAMLLLASSFPVMKHHRDDRIHAQRDLLNGSNDTPRSAHSLLMTDLSTTYHGRAVRGRAVQPDGPDAALPPGLRTYPAPGAMAVSPALAELLDSPDGLLLKQRIDHPVTGTIGPDGLAGPNDYAFYLGSDQLAKDPEALRLDHFGQAEDPKPLEAVLLLLSVVGVVIMLTPVGVFVAAAARFGGEARDRRLAALRLVGADRAAIRRIAAGESLAGAALGLALGVVFFLVGCQLLELVTFQGLSVFASDLEPDPVLGALALGAVPVLSVVVTLLAMRRISAEPLAVVRTGSARRRRIWWRIALPVVGAFVLYRQSADLQGVSQTAGLAQLIAGLLLLLVGTTALLPPLLDGAARLLGRAGPPSWQLAVRRIQLAPETAARPVSGIVVAVAGAVALQALLGTLAAARTPSLPGSPAGEPMMQVYVPGGAELAMPYAAKLRGTPGVLGTTGYQQFYVNPPTAGQAHPAAAGGGTGAAAGNGLGGTNAVGGTDTRLLAVRISDCAGLRVFARVGDCKDGDLFASPDLAAQWPAAGEQPGGRTVTVSEPPGLSTGPAVPWRLPALRGAVEPLPDPRGSMYEDQGATLYATTGAVPAALLKGSGGHILVRVDPTTPDYTEHIRTSVALMDSHAHVVARDTPGPDKVFLSIRRALTAGVAATLALIAASMLVATVEQLRDRRRNLAVLTAFGTRRRTLAWSVFWQSLAPVLIGLTLAVGAGVGLARVLLDLAHLPVNFDWGQIGVMTGTGLGLVLATTVLSLPVLWRSTRATGLRHE
ncbi:integral membrane protein [Kitasatospora sp. MMS16-BH015]|uniref:ABC transporter permease n=1 Tax=Kitasatospora sp. MMS16-BH015 TaxID=2018025 RepID=UPI000CA1526C|nr:ABC transporter permease [Kitasatospora sp. MMS16-BH015]AUG82167.1 integral membrane protein [Kitasatospora sp. MMS16-BH015]